MCDDDKDGKISMEEITTNNEIWLDSDATEYGQQLKNAHEEL